MVLGIVARLCGLSIWILIRILKDELILAYSTASSESVLPRIIEKMEAYGAPASITSFVVPTGYPLTRWFHAVPEYRRYLYCAAVWH